MHPSTPNPHEYVAAAAAAGMTVGTTHRHLSPWGDIKLAQVTTWVVRAGVAETKYIPAPVTRGQCAFFIWRLMTATAGGD